MAASCGHGAVGMVNKVESLLECSVCLETLNDPRTLPCFHSFCKICLEKIIHNERIEKKKSAKIEDFSCPACRSVFHLKSNEEVAGLPCSHFIRNMLEAVQLQDQAKHASCTKCNKQEASCRCLTCELFLCLECLAEHNSVRDSWPGFQKIACSILTIKELTMPENQSKIKRKSVLHCSKHEGKKLKFYCQTCKELICRYCMDFIHIRPDHECAPTGHVIEQRRESLQSSLSAFESKLSSANERLRVVCDAQEKLKANAQNVKESINNDKEQIKLHLLQQLEEGAQKTCNEVDKILSEAQEIISKQQTETQSFVNELNVSYNLAKNILESGNSLEIIEAEGIVADRLASVERAEKEKNTSWITGAEIEYGKNQVDVNNPQKVVKFGFVKFRGEYTCNYYVFRKSLLHF